MKRFERLDYLTKQRRTARAWARSWPLFIFAQAVLFYAVTGQNEVSFWKWFGLFQGAIFDVVIVNVFMFAWLAMRRLIGLYAVAIFMCWYSYLCVLSGVNFIKSGALLSVRDYF